MIRPRPKSIRAKDATLARQRALVRTLIAQTTGLVDGLVVDDLDEPTVGRAVIVPFFGGAETTRIQPVETRAEIIPFPRTGRTKSAK